MPACPFCNEGNPLTARHCSACGAALDSDPSERDAADGPVTVDAEKDDELVELLRSRQKIAAIKLYREQAGCGLKEAKEYVESLAVQRGIESQSSGCAGMLLLFAVVSSIVAVTAVQYC
jgi:hypothetical protein